MLKITKRQLRRIIREAVEKDFFSDREANPHDDSMYGEPEGGYGDAISPEAWADQNGLQLELDNEGQKIIYLDNEQADRLDMPAGVRWDAIRNPAGDGWVIYTGEFQ